MGDVQRSIRQKIDRDAVIRAALVISRRTSTRDAQPITGATIGHALQVDRSAVWRHFPDKYQLIVAVADQALERLTYPPPARTSPWERLEGIARGAIEVFREHPTLAREVAGVPALRENGLRLAETVLAELAQLGMPIDRAARYYRVFMELTMSYACTLAIWDLRPAEQRKIDEQTVRSALTNLDLSRFPHLAAAGPLVAELDIAQGTDLVIDCLRITLESFLVRQ